MIRRVRLFVTPWTVSCQTPLSMEFSRQEYWNGLPFPTPRDPPDPRIELMSLYWQVDFYHRRHLEASIKQRTT